MIRRVATFIITAFWLCVAATNANAETPCTTEAPNGGVYNGFCVPANITPWRYYYHQTGADPDQAPAGGFDSLETFFNWLFSSSGAIGIGSGGCSPTAIVEKSAEPEYKYQTEIRTSYVFDGTATCANGGVNWLATPKRIKVITCPAGYYKDGPNVPIERLCFSHVALNPTPAEPPSCKNTVDGEIVGNPIIPSTGDKYRNELDWSESGVDGLSIRRIYRSNWGRSNSNPDVGLGRGWVHNHSARLVVNLDATPHLATVVSAEGYRRTFSRPQAEMAWASTNNADRLIESAGTWFYTNADDGATSQFGSNGKIQSLTQKSGRTITYSYSTNGQLAFVTNAFGRTLSMGYTNGKLTTATTPDGRVIGYSYDSSERLTGVTYPDGTSKVFVYENSSFPFALTGIIDESANRWGTFSYLADGRASNTSLAGGVSNYSVAYPSATSSRVTDPLGTTRTYTYSTNFDRLAVTSSTAPSGNDALDARIRSQDINGLIISEQGFANTQRTTNWDASRRLPILVSEGTGYDTRSTSFQWHGSLSLPTEITEQGRRTSIEYDNYGNPISAAVTDTTNSPNVTRTWQWTYNSQSLPATQKAPNGAVTIYTNDAQGNVATETNALGQVTQYDYDSANRLVTITAPNGLVTTLSYDARDRLLSKTHGGLQTTFTYNPTSTLATITLPSGLVVNFTYDAAHRLKGWSNNRGELGLFTLDAMGNHTAEVIKDSSGSVAWAVAQSINNLNRISLSTVGANQTNTYRYNNAGQLTSVVNGLNQARYFERDSLDRLNWVANASYQATTITSNALDQVSSVRDAKGVVTSYGRDALGNATSESSSDIGARSAQYDSMGLPSQIVDALGQATQIQRDALGRPTLITFADGQSTTLSYDLTAESKGYLSQIDDRSGTTMYSRDALGRVTSKQQVLVNGAAAQVNYAYLVNGLLGSITYPGGAVLSYGYDATGRITQIDWNGSPLITNITWNPMGRPTGWSWAFVSPGLSASRSYDTAGRMTATEFSSYVYNAAGRIATVTQQVLQPADNDPTQASIASVSKSWTVSYDAAGRVTGFNAPGDTSGFSYDANGNRSGSTRTFNAQTTSRTYTVDGTSNKLTGFSQTMGNAATSVTYGYNANGDLTSDGLRSFGYNAEGRLSAVTTGASDMSPTTRYTHNALGQRVFKTDPQLPPYEGDEGDPSFWAGLMSFFQNLSTAPMTQNDGLGLGYTYDELGNLLSEIGTGGANSSGSTRYIYLPTANGAMPIAAVFNGQTFYAVQSDHLNTPRRLIDATGMPAWQWVYSAFGDEKPTTANWRFANLDVNPNPGSTGAPPLVFNLRYPGQYADSESGLNYNYFRSYSPTSGRYTQPDPIGLDGGWNRFGYVDGNPLGASDPKGLQTTFPGPFGLPVPMPTPRPGRPTSLPLDPTEPYGPMYTPNPSGSLPGWLKNWLPKSALEECEQEADSALERDYAYCKALGGTFNDHRTRKACEEKAFSKYVKRLQSCKEQCR